MPRLTRGQVAERLGLSVSSVRRLEREGVLVPELGEGGVRLFSEEQVTAARAQREQAATSERDVALPAVHPLAPTDGSLAALAFAHFDQGESPVQVVQALLELSPPVVKVLYEQWRELGALMLEGW